MIGQLGGTARRIRYRLLPRLGDGLDVVVVLAGANAVMAGRKPAQWRDDLSGILMDLAGRTAQIVVTGAADGFHPSAAGYRHWAQVTAAHLNLDREQ